MSFWRSFNKGDNAKRIPWFSVFPSQWFVNTDDQNDGQIKKKNQTTKVPQF